MNKGQELVEAQTTELQVFDEFEARIVELEKHIKDKSYDLATEAGIDECEADKNLLRKVEIGIEKKRKSKGASLLQATKDLNASAKVWHARVHGMWEVLDKPLQVMRQIALNAEIDAREKEQAELKAIEEKREANLKAREAIMAAKEAEQAIKDNAAQAERDAAKHKEELEAAALLAAEQATRNAELKAKYDADVKAKEIADKYAAQQAEQDAIDEADRKRQANGEHRKEFNNLALDAIVAVTGDPASSLRLVKAIIKGQIPNVTMLY